MVESSVKTISRPVIDRLPVDQLDQFACRQLDKVLIFCIASPSRSGLARDVCSNSLTNSSTDTAVHLQAHRNDRLLQ